MKGLLLRLYPRRWRRRYGGEMARLLDDLGPLTRRQGYDLFLGAIDAHLTMGATMSSSARAAVRRALVVAGIVWLILSVVIVLSNVVFASAQDDDGPWVVAGYLAVFASFLIVGRLAARDTPDRRIHAVAGAVAGAVTGILVTGTFFAVDNIFLSTISKQQTKIDGLAQSGMTSMRTYVNQGLIGPLVFWTIGFAVIGAMLAMAGAASGRPATPRTAKD